MMNVNDAKQRIFVIAHAHPDFSLGGGEIAAYNLFEGYRDSDEVEQAWFLGRADRGRGVTGAISMRRPNEYLWEQGIGDWHLMKAQHRESLMTWFADLIRALRPTVIHAHHYMHLGLEFLNVIKQVDPTIRVYMTLHEYMAICRNNGQMVKTDGRRLCSRESFDECHQCFPQHTAEDFWLRKHFFMKHFDLVDGFVAPSEFLRQRYIAWGIAAERIVVIENGQPDLAPLPPRPIAAGEGRNRFGFFGQITPYKGLHVLLEALSHLRKKERRRLVLEVHGANLALQTAEYRERIEALRKPLIKEGVVEWPGAYESHQLRQRMGGVDWIVVPSTWWENSPMVIQESFLCGRPLLVSNIGGMAEKVRHGVDGMQVATGSALQWGRAMVAAGTSTDVWEQLSAGIVRPSTHRACAAAHLQLMKAVGPGPTMPAAVSVRAQKTASPDWHAIAGSEIAQALTPALGYFGATRSDQLIVDVGATVRELRLSLAEPAHTFLNLRKLELLRDGKAVDVPAHGCRTQQSSVAGDAASHGPVNLLAGRGIHSGAESSPWWSVTFDPPVQIDQLRVHNRGDGWGSRSRTLSVDAIFVDNSRQCLYRGQAQVNLRRSLLAAAQAADTVVPAVLPVSPAAVKALRSKLLVAAADRLRTRQLALADVDWRNVVPMLDVWGKCDEPGRDEWTLIAAFLLSQQQARIGTSIKSFSLMLDSRARLQRLQREIDDLGRALGLGGFMLTRHGVKPEGVLRADPERFLAHTQAVVDVLASLGREPVLAYGTLLGAIRDRHFIAHDDDIDLLYRSNAGSRPEVEAELLTLKDDLRAAGFKVVDLLPNTLNMHVIDPRNGTVMDVFPCWEDAGSLQMHMEGMKVRGIDPTIVYPAGNLEFLGRTLPVPAKPEAYLEERYGPDWQNPDQFFEWPWQLKG